MINDFQVAILTYKRPEFFSQCLSSVLQFVDKNKVFIVNDGSPYDETLYQGVQVIQNKENLGVAKSKNVAFKHFLESNNTHFFLLEDDIIIKRSDTFSQYIKTAQKTGILHFNYGPGSPFNRRQDPSIRVDLDTRDQLDQFSEPNPKLIVDYGDNIKVALYEHTVAMFAYFHRKVLEQVGLMDESFSEFLSWEHVHQTQRIVDAKMTSPFWWFADIFNSHEYLTEAPGAIKESAIAKDRTEWMKKVMKGRELYKSKMGYYPNHSPLKSEVEVLQILKEIKTHE